MKIKPEDFQYFIDDLMSISPDERQRLSDSDLKQTEKEHTAFSKELKRGRCYLCGEKIVRCDYKKPCLHWLFRAHKRIKKKQIEQALRTKDLFQIISYLRWVATHKRMLGAINDIDAYEEREGLAFHETIEYESLSWTFWIKESDLRGHERRQIDFPHYHFYMKIEGRDFITFGDFHIPLSEWDIFNIYAHRKRYPELEFTIPYGETYSDIFNKAEPADIKNLVGSMKSTTDESKAQFRLQTIIRAKNGEKIKIEDLKPLFKERDETGVPLAVLAKKLDAKVSTIVSPVNLVEPVLRKESKKGR